MAIKDATDGEVFLAYLAQVLGAQLQPGDVVVMDNLSAHKVQGVRDLIQQTGAELRYLPPYSPDFNPMTAASASGTPCSSVNSERALAARSNCLTLDQHISLGVIDS